MAENDDQNNNNNAFDDDVNNNTDYQDETRYCKIYDREDFFTVLVQMILAVLALLSLYFKRLQEVPRRTFRTWSLDIGKQALGACYAHVLNMVRIKLIWCGITGQRYDISAIARLTRVCSSTCRCGRLF
jgi:hypothetical protein